MSTIILGENLPVLGDYHSSLFSVDSSKSENLADYVRRARTAKGLSTTDVESASRIGGAKGISDAYVTRIENGYVTNVSPDKLHALAKGLGVSEDELFAVARGRSIKPRKPLSPVDLPPEIAADVEMMVSMFVDIPRECQLDTLASLAGIHARRSESKRIHERHEARAEARQALDKRTPKKSNIENNGPVRVATPLDEWEGERRWPKGSEQESDVPAKKKQA